MAEKFEHRAMELNQRSKIVFIAMSKHLFYFRRHAVKFVLERGFTPISQFGIFDYFMVDSVDRDLVRKANNNLIRVSDELWVFGPISDGVLAEVKMVKEMGKPIKYFSVVNSKVKEIAKDELQFEDSLERFSSEM
ncbi:MAG: hypothetical protein V1850_02250 [Candidatus Bathyarchaeota archaeon]